jgi:hypothetical protein
MAVVQCQPSTAAKPTFIAMAMGGDPKPRAKEDGTLKVSLGGEPTSSIQVVVLRADGQGQERFTSVAVYTANAQVFPLGTFLRPEGAVQVTPYVTDSNRLGLSYVVERLVPCPSPIPASVSEPAPSRKAGE